MTSSWEGKSKWPGVVLGKIKSLWSTSHGTASDGLNQLIDSSTNKNHNRHINTPTKIIEGLNQLSFNKGRQILFSVVFYFLIYRNAFCFFVFYY